MDNQPVTLGGMYRPAGNIFGLAPFNRKEYNIDKIRGHLSPVAKHTARPPPATINPDLIKHEHMDRPVHIA